MLRSMTSLLLKGGTVVGSDRSIRDDVLLRDGMVEEVDRFVEEYDELEDVSGKLIFPGLMDTHVHFREPGFPEKATMQSEAIAARAGGITAVCDMPNTVPPTVTVEAFADKVQRAAAIKDVEIRFFFGITQQEHLEEFEKLMTGTAPEMKKLRSRLAGVKIFLEQSVGNQKIDPSLLDAVFAACTKHKVVLVAHCEDAEINAQTAAQNTRTGAIVHSLIRPSFSEMAAVKQAVGLAKKNKTHLHIAHVSTEGAVGLIRAAKEEGVHVTCEVTPHHLFFATDDYERLGGRIKVNPPIRSYKHRTALWQAIQDGVVDCIASDHAPHLLSEKEHSDPLKAPSGVPGVETLLPLLLSVAHGKWPHPAEPHMSCPEFTVQDIVRLCLVNPAKIFGFRREEIGEDRKADLVIVDPKKEWTIHGEELHSKCKWTPYEGWVVRGKVEKVI